MFSVAKASLGPWFLETKRVYLCSGESHMHNAQVLCSLCPDCPPYLKALARLPFWKKCTIVGRP